MSSLLVRRLVGFVGVAGFAAAGLVAVVVPAAEAAPETVTFSYTGSAVTWTVPDGVCAVTIRAVGAAGGGDVDSLGGPGGVAEGTFEVVPGETLEVRVGGSGAPGGSGGSGGFNGGGNGGSPGAHGGGGGGASDVRRGGSGLADRILVAGGGGGGGGDSRASGGAGGDGGTPSGDGQPGVAGRRRRWRNPDQRWNRWHRQCRRRHCGRHGRHALAPAAPAADGGDGGGGGGGGWYGGGGGGGASDGRGPTGGGGGGSSFGTPLGTSTEAAQVAITYDPAITVCTRTFAYTGAPEEFVVPPVCARSPSPPSVRRAAPAPPASVRRLRRDGGRHNPGDTR